MQITEFTVRLILILMPGIITNKIICKLTNRSEENLGMFLLSSSVFGIITYASAFLLSSFVNSLYKGIFYGFFEVIKENDVIDLFYFLKILINNELEKLDCLYMIAMGIFLGFDSLVISFLFSKVENHGYLSKIARKLRVTNKFSQKDVWANTFDNINENIWVRIRKFKEGVIYEGWVRKFSSTKDRKELLLEDVYIYNLKTAYIIGKAKDIYLSMKSDEDIAVEFIDQMK